MNKTALLTQFSPFKDQFLSIKTTPLKLPKMQWLLLLEIILMIPTFAAARFKPFQKIYLKRDKSLLMAISWLKMHSHGSNPSDILETFIYFP